MAIQFQCPHCQAAIRVGDAAGGKRGKCPKCQQPVLVPVVRAPTQTETNTPAVSPSPTEGDSFSAESSTATEPAFDFHVPAVTDSTAGEPLPVVRRRAKKKSIWGVVVPVLLFASMIGGVFLMMRDAERPLEGKLAGEQLPEFNLPAEAIDIRLISLEPDRRRGMLEALIQDPLPQAIVPKQLRLTIDATTDGLSVQIEPMAGVVVVRINPMSDPELRHHIDKHRKAWISARTDGLVAGLNSFVKWFEKGPDSSGSFNTGRWIEELAYPALERGAGYAVEVVDNKRVHRCVYEDKQGKLYFLLPVDTSSVRLRGRQLNDPNIPNFQGRYEIKISPANEAEATDARPTTAS